MRNGTALSLGPVSMTPLPSLWISARSRLDIAIGPLLSDAAKQLQNLSTALPKYAYFRFPGSEAALTLNELRHAGSTLSFSFPRDAPGPVSVEILLSNFGSSGPTNFVDLSSKRSIKCGMDFVTYVPPGSSMDCIAAGLVTAAQRQFGCAAASISSAGESGLAFKCFQPKGMKHVLSLAGTEEQAVRSDLHKLLRLPVLQCFYQIVLFHGVLKAILGHQASSSIPTFNVGLIQDGGREGVALELPIFMDFTSMLTTCKKILMTMAGVVLIAHSKHVSAGTECSFILQRHCHQSQTSKLI